MTINERYDAAKAALAAVKDGDDADAIKAAIAEFKAAEDAKKAADDAATLVKSLANTTTTKEPGTMPNDAPKTLGEYAEKNLDLAAVKAGGASRTPFGFKAATDVHVVGEVAVQSQTIVDPQPIDSIRDLFGAETISGNAITFYQMGLTEGSAAPVQENGAKPQIHVNYEPVTVPLIKVAAWFYETDELLSDAPYLRSAIDNRGLFELRRMVNATLIGGLFDTDGIGSYTYDPSTDKLADAILGAIMQVKSATGYDADAVLINPADYFALRTATDGGQYYGGGYFYGPYGNGSVTMQPGVWGLRTLISESVPQGVPMVGAFRSAASVVTKAGEGAAIEVHRGDHDDAIHNRVTVVVEERLALAVRVPAAFCVVTTD